MEKFQYDTDFQLDILRFILNDKYGTEVIPMLKSGNFTLIEHAIIFETIESHFKEKGRIPKKILFKEKLRKVLYESDLAKELLKEDKDAVFKQVNHLYTSPQDSDILFEEIRKFKKYCDVNDIVERYDLKNIEGYDKLLGKLDEAIADKFDRQEKLGQGLIRDILNRQIERKLTKKVIETPFRQLNNLTNAGGYPKGSIIVLLDNPKRFKTGMMINFAKGYMKMKKKVLYIDLENGEEEILTRLEQSIIGESKMEILKGNHNDRVRKLLRRYSRLGAEVVVKRLPGFSNCNDIQHVIDSEYRDHGNQFDILIVDYAAQMQSIRAKDDDFNRISEVYVELGNLAVKNDLDHIITANHIVRKAQKRSKTRYEANDIAKCIDIVRHAQVIVGLNRDELDIAEDFIRLEIVEQRDGQPSGSAVFRLDVSSQHVKELSKTELQDYRIAKQDMDFDDEDIDEKPTRSNGDI